MDVNRKPSLRRIGILDTAAPDLERLSLWTLFKQSLTDLGYLENVDIAYKTRWADGRQERLAGAAAELVRANVDILVTAGTPAAAAASRATTRIPIVMATGVGLGTQLTEGTTQRNSNITGISDLPPGVSARRLQLLCELLTSQGALAFLADRANPSSQLALRETQDIARQYGIDVRDYWVPGPDQIANALSKMKSDNVVGFIVAPGAMFFAQRRTLAASAIRHQLASMSVRREYAEAGCLMAYGAPIHQNYRQAAHLVSNILQGAKVADLPLAQPTEFDFIINQATARAIGVTIPQSLLRRAAVIDA